ncbi:patatin-like phospholipase family protein [Limnoraphis robusta]|uniref:Patatin-like phospholipase family protein n=1 Tax=Limnoraphis robusta CCNP1315 TaxID=3110306 RepID=A0ABU5U382_9CYAN|nr:patatin-like phospholipase family protein [Limnoraphis robusta]MEA5495792.1 patatin-like phospholipase family protein [Limnoraphis robusta BA-68 BA1]MEA5521088.1 patatin-like phospholipase family protein [Limnoraphis robusta CCNP1315]MEA5543467.1 patatin-like phospholipase family protein [Limnoraphis robusta CCNP1324]
MTFKILSLDGGGIRGVLSATILKEVEKTLIEKTGKKLHNYFNLIAGTSTGSILAAGIASKMNGNELVDVYKEEGKNIFLNSVRWQRKWRLVSQFLGWGSCVLYPHESGDQGLANVLKRKLIDKKSGKCLTIRDITDTQLLILSYDVLSRNTTWFANDDPDEWWYKNNLELWQICTASASAPTFFPPYELPYNSEEFLPHIDGGVSANNPELAAIVHVLSMKRNDQPKVEINNISVLSISTGRTTRPYTYSEVKRWGAAKWVANLPHIFLDPSSEISDEITHRLFLSVKPQNYLRLDFDLNERFEERTQSKQLRKLLKNPYNKYIWKDKSNKEKKDCKVCEDIDNPDACPELIEAAECYIKHGKVYYQGEMVPVRSAIEQFIDSHPVTKEDQKEE